MKGHIEKARDIFQQASNEGGGAGAGGDYERSNAVAALCNCLYEVGVIYMMGGFYEDALTYFQKGLSEVGNEWHSESNKARFMAMIAQCQQ